MNYYIKPTADIFIKYLLTDKESILDVKATDENGRQYDIEVQSSGNEFFKNRSLYYWAKLYSSQLEEGGEYVELRPTICINILDFKLFSEIESLHTCFLLREKNFAEYVLTDHLVIHFLEVPKLRDEKVKTKLEKWLFYLKYEGREEEKMKILLKDNDINKAHKAYKRFTEDERLREIYEARMKSKRDYNTDIALARRDGLKNGEEIGIKKGEEIGIKKGEEIGIKKGEEIGIKEAKLANAKKMLLKKYQIKEIAEITGLSEEEIKKLR